MVPIESYLAHTSGCNKCPCFQRAPRGGFHRYNLLHNNLTASKRPPVFVLLHRFSVIMNSYYCEYLLYTDLISHRSHSASTCALQATSVSNTDRLFSLKRAATTSSISEILCLGIIDIPESGPPIISTPAIPYASYALRVVGFDKIRYALMGE